jgi:hypothetical protein
MKGVKIMKGKAHAVACDQEFNWENEEAARILL